MTRRSTPDSVAQSLVSGRSHSKGSRDGPSSLNKILDKLCQIHGTPEKPANHTHRECWIFKEAGKLNAEHKGRETPSEDEDEPRQPNIGGQKKFPSEVKTVNMIYVTHIPKRTRKRALRDVYVMEPVAPNSTHGQIVRSPLIEGIILLASVMAAQPHWS